MTSTQPARPNVRRIQKILVALPIVVIAASGCRLLASAASTAAVPIVLPGSAEAPLPSAEAPLSSAEAPPRSAEVGALGEADGLIPDGTTAFADDIPGVAMIDPDLLAALRRAAVDAGHDGVKLLVESGWRSPAYQDQLLREAISRYGSASEAARWVATAATSPHVSGDAIDIAPAAAATWLSKRGAAYGLCPIYRN